MGRVAYLEDNELITTVERLRFLTRTEMQFKMLKPYLFNQEPIPPKVAEMILMMTEGMDSCEQTLEEAIAECDSIINEK